MTTRTILNSLAEAAARGAAWLDGERPGWAGKITLATLDMQNCYCCAVGQLFGDFRRENNQRGWSKAWVSAHGFSTPVNGQDEWRALTNAWRAEILRRREGKP